MKARNTQAKQLVQSIFEASSTPLLINEVYEQVKIKLPQTAYSTIYRIIQSFHADGKLITIDWRERGSRYEWAAKEHHHHLICNSCGEVSDIDDTILNFKVDAVAKKTGFLVQDHSIELFGECSPCQRSK